MFRLRVWVDAHSDPLKSCGSAANGGGTVVRPVADHYGIVLVTKKKDNVIFNRMVGNPSGLSKKQETLQSTLFDLCSPFYLYTSSSSSLLPHQESPSGS